MVAIHIDIIINELANSRKKSQKIDLAEIQSNTSSVRHHTKKGIYSWILKKIKPVDKYHSSS